MTRAGAGCSLTKFRKRNLKQGTVISYPPLVNTSAITSALATITRRCWYRHSCVSPWLNVGGPSDKDFLNQRNFYKDEIYCQISFILIIFLVRRRGVELLHPLKNNRLRHPPLQRPRPPHDAMTRRKPFRAHDQGSVPVIAMDVC